MQRFDVFLHLYRLKKTKPKKIITEWNPSVQVRKTEHMKKIVLMIIPALICGMMLISCDKEEQEFGTGNWEIRNDGSMVLRAFNLENAPKNVATVKVRMSAFSQDPNVSPYIEVASAEYKNGGFELTFPSTVSDEYLQPFFLSGSIVGRIGTVIHNNIHAFDKGGEYLGSFSLVIHDERNEYLGGMSFTYSNNKFSVEGTGAFGGIDDLFYEKGWNAVYSYFFRSTHPQGLPTSNDIKRTTQRPANRRISFVWYFSPPHTPH